MTIFLVATISACLGASIAVVAMAALAMSKDERPREFIGEHLHGDEP